MKRGMVFLIWLFPLVFSSAQMRTADPQFSVERGFFNAAFQVSLTCSTPGAMIRYTLDGSEPTVNKGKMYTIPLDITGTTVLRAIAYLNIMPPSDVITQSYFFIEDILQQPAEIEGYPNQVYWAGSAFGANHDHEMDPDIVNDPAYQDDIRDGFISIPTMSLVMQRDNFWSAYDDDSIESASVELIYPNQPSQNEQVNCGFTSYSTKRLKRSMRLIFKAEYGASKWESGLFRNAPLNGITAADAYDNIILRAGNNRSWARIHNDDRVAYTRDQWYRDSQIEMSGIGSHGAFVHVFVNGIYWGLYNAVERPDENFSAAYLGGEDVNWFSISHAGIHSGDPTRWDYLADDLIDKDMTNTGNYKTLQDYLNIPFFYDYLILTWYTGMSDWPVNNWWGANRNDPETPFLFYGWDCELSWDETDGSNLGAWVHPAFRSNETTLEKIPLIWHAARENSNFMMAFADCVYKHCFHEGALTGENSQQRWMILNDAIRNAIVCESARWGDAMEDNGHPTRTRDGDWQTEVKRVSDLMENNVQQFLDALRIEGYYPDIDPPVILPRSGQITQNFQISIQNPNTDGDIYFTTDGSDPREPGGDVAFSAQLHDENNLLTLSETTTLKTRILSEGKWSALNESSYYGLQDFSGLRITEIMYHPPDEGALDGDLFEFIELKNIGNDILNISGIAFYEGVDYTFPDGLFINPGSYLVLGKDAVEFEKKYGYPPFDIYSGNLSNSGETIALADPLENPIMTIAYFDTLPWPLAPDGDGYSLIPKSEIESNSNDPKQWKSSFLPGGSPGFDDDYFLDQNLKAIKISEIMYRPPNWTWNDGDDFEFIELQNTGADTLNISGISFTDGIDYTFPGGTILYPNTFIVLARQAAMFEMKYDFPPFGEYSRSLSNNGEKLVLSDHKGVQILSVSYGIEFPWPEEANGEDYSLVPADIYGDGDPNDPNYWKISYVRGGSPGREDMNTSVKNSNSQIPEMFSLEQNYPNPFNMSTIFRYNLAAKSDVRFMIFDVAGRQVKVLVDRSQEAGSYSIKWDGNDFTGRHVSSGVYFYRIQISSNQKRFIGSKKMLLLK